MLGSTVEINATKVQVKFVIPTDWEIVLNHNRIVGKFNTYAGIFICSDILSTGTYDKINAKLILPKVGKTIIINDITPQIAENIGKAISELMKDYDKLVHGAEQSLTSSSVDVGFEAAKYSIKSFKCGVNSNICAVMINKNIIKKYKNFMPSPDRMYLIEKYPILYFHIFSKSSEVKTIYIKFTEKSGDHYVGISCELDDDQEKYLVSEIVKFCEV